MLRLTDYSTFTPETPELPWIQVTILIIALVVGYCGLVWAAFAPLDRKKRIAAVVVSASVFAGGGIGGIALITSDGQANDRVTASVQIWLEDGYGITASTDDVRAVFHDREPLVVKYDGELTPVAILDVTGGAITIVSSDSTKPLTPIR